MKINHSIFSILFIVLLLSLLCSCKKEAIPFTPTEFGTVTDIDGNIYKTVTIGTQTWMAENLKTTKYRNGDPIPNVTNSSSWSYLTTGSYCWYDNDLSTYKATYGALYNWYAVTDSRNLAPLGWHVPTNLEWIILIDFLRDRGEKIGVGDQLKESGTDHWKSPSTGTNSSGFTALPGGFRSGGYTNQQFQNGGRDGLYTQRGVWWTSTATDHPFDNFSAIDYDIQYNSSNILGGNGSMEGSYTRGGESVRCVKD